MGLFQLLLRLFLNYMLISENASILEIKRHPCWFPQQIVAGNQSILHSVETSLDAVVVSALAVAVGIDPVFPR